MTILWWILIIALAIPGFFITGMFLLVLACCVIDGAIDISLTFMSWFKNPTQPWGR